MPRRIRTRRARFPACRNYHDENDLTGRKRKPFVLDRGHDASRQSYNVILSVAKDLLALSRSFGRCAPQDDTLAQMHGHRLEARPDFPSRLKGELLG
jgi:hypothetical protein